MPVAAYAVRSPPAPLVSACPCRATPLPGAALPIPLLGAAAKMWDDKVAAAGKAWEDQVKAVTGSAEAALDAGISKVSAVVRRCAAVPLRARGGPAGEASGSCPAAAAAQGCAVAAGVSQQPAEAQQWFLLRCPPAGRGCSGLAEVSRETSAVKARAEQFYETGVAHYEVSVVVVRLTAVRQVCTLMVTARGGMLAIAGVRLGHPVLLRGQRWSQQHQAAHRVPPARPQATEAQALELLRRGVRCVAVDYRQESIAAGVVAAAVLLPGPRRFLFRHTLGR